MHQLQKLAHEQSILNTFTFELHSIALTYLSKREMDSRLVGTFSYLFWKCHWTGNVKRANRLHYLRIFCKHAYAQAKITGYIKGCSYLWVPQLTPAPENHLTQQVLRMEFRRLNHLVSVYVSHQDVTHGFIVILYIVSLVILDISGHF